MCKIGFSLLVENEFFNLALLQVMITVKVTIRKLIFLKILTSELP